MLLFLFKLGGRRDFFSGTVIVNAEKTSREPANKKCESPAALPEEPTSEFVRNGGPSRVTRCMAPCHTLSEIPRAVQTE